MFALLGLGLVFGLKHATEVDHVVAVSTIAREHRNVLRSALVGGLCSNRHRPITNRAIHTLSVAPIVFLVFE